MFYRFGAAFYFIFIKNQKNYTFGLVLNLQITIRTPK
jgi:hypothetical protein